ncbi:MAG: galactokinase [Bacteroidetes bacterium]|nr:galactokinase [Bacteroidota bacterium]
MNQKIINAFGSWKGNAEGLIVSCAPGRVNLIGDHTDYNEGFVLPMILDRAIYVAARVVDSDLYHLRSENFNEEIKFEVNQWPNIPTAHWATYVAGMIREIPPPCPVEMLIIGDIPDGAGLSSSAALEIAVGLALEELRGISMSPLKLAQVGQKVEHQYVNVKCGIMDQIVSRVGRSDHALLLDCQLLEWEHIPFGSPEIKICVVDSRVKRQLAHSKYNERREECQNALKTIQSRYPRVHSVRDIELHHLGQLKDPILRQRIRHVLNENARVIQARDAIEQLDWNSLGVHLSASHRSLRDDYEVSCEELDFIVRHAESLKGVFGARMMGGGFGGCTINLVEATKPEMIAESITRVTHLHYDQSVFAYILGSGIEAGVMRL